MRENENGDVESSESDGEGVEVSINIQAVQKNMFNRETFLRTPAIILNCWQLRIIRTKIFPVNILVFDFELILVWELFLKCVF